MIEVVEERFNGKLEGGFNGCLAKGENKNRLREFARGTV